MGEKGKNVTKIVSESFRTEPEDHEASKKNIQVACRFRPLNIKEKESNEKLAIEISSDLKTVSIKNQFDSLSNTNFSFDKIFTSESTQKEVFEDIGKPIVESVLEGFNGTILAYGQTGSGKSYTMIGPDLNNPSQTGLIPRMVKQIFQHIEEADVQLEFTVKVAYCELYLEKIRDLLYSDKRNLKICEDKIRGIYIKNITEEYVSNESEVYSLLKIGKKNREVGSTIMNEESSRSHAIFMITINSNNTTDLSAKTGKLYLVDLAGSEKLSKTGAEGRRLDETKNINKSLSTLGNVIFALTDGKSSHVPYRDSKLTRVLQDSLGGNSKTSLIITCSSTVYNELETISTLRFGIRAKAVKNKPKVNKECTIAELKLMLAQAHDNIAKKDQRILWLEKGACFDNPECVNNKETSNKEAFKEILESLNKENKKNSDLNELNTNLTKDLNLQISKNNGLIRENDNLNTKINELLYKLQEYEEKLQDFNDSSNKLQAKTEVQEKQILCLMDTNKNLDKRIDLMQEKILKKTSKIQVLASKNLEMVSFLNSKNIESFQ